MRFYQKLAYYLDECFSIPGTRIRFGIDAILGLIPGVGDLVMMATSFIIVGEAFSQRLPVIIIFRMLLNIIIETSIGAIPLLGDIFDVFWKSNKKNAELIDRYVSSPAVAKRESLVVLSIVGFVTLSIFGFLIWGLVEIIKVIFSLV